jgi:hypothetical protein
MPPSTNEISLPFAVPDWTTAPGIVDKPDLNGCYLRTKQQFWARAHFYWAAKLASVDDAAWANIVTTGYTALSEILSALANQRWYNNRSAITDLFDVFEL